MNRHTALKLLLRITFTLSLSLLIISMWHIYRADVKVKANLLQWEKLKEAHDEKAFPSRLDMEADDLRISPLLAHPPLFTTPQEQQGTAAGDAQYSETKEEISELPLYENTPTQGELIGTITIPAIDKELPIVHGTDSKQLSEGVGHYIGSALPGERNNSVLAGHRDTVFRGLGKVQIGDQIQVETVAGVFTYVIEKQQIVEEDDRTIIVSSDEPLLTVVTCYPFDYVGLAPQRYILTGKLVDP